MACEIEVFARVTGFFQKVQGYNPGKVSEFSERKMYDISSSNVVGRLRVQQPLDGRPEEGTRHDSEELRGSLQDKEIYACQDA